MIEFQGWDWCELLPLLNLEKEYEDRVANEGNIFEAEEQFTKYVANQIDEYYYSHTEEENTEFIRQLRIFLQKIIDNNTGYDAPYFQGILNIQHDEVFLRCFGHNLAWMWN